MRAAGICGDCAKSNSSSVLILGRCASDRRRWPGRWQDDSCQCRGRRPARLARRVRRSIELRMKAPVALRRERAEKAAIIVTTNLPFSEWPQVFTNARLCKAVLDRLTDQAHIIETGSESYRFRRTLRKKTKE